MIKKGFTLITRETVEDQKKTTIMASKNFTL